MGDEGKWTLVTRRASDVEITVPKYPMAVKVGDQWRLEVKEGRDYRIPNDPIKAMGLLHHLSQKTWADRLFLQYAISRVATAMGWEIHPF